GPRGIDAIKRASAAVERVKEPKLEAQVDLMRARVIGQQGKYKEAIALLDHVATTFQSAGQTYRAAMTIVRSFNMRMTIDRYAEVKALIKQWRPVIAANGIEDDLRRVDKWAAMVRYTEGDVEGGHADLVRLWRQHPDRVPPHPLVGVVVDRAGKPVAGAQVVTGNIVQSDTVGILLPWGDDDSDNNQLRVTTSNADGTFVFTDAPENGAVQAQLGSLRSVAVLTAADPKKPMPGRTLVLQPTRRIAGKVAYGKADVTDVMVTINDPADRTSRAILALPLKPDGTFAIDGAAQTKVNITVNVQTSQGMRFGEPKQIAPGTGPISDLALAVPPSSARKMTVLTRSTYSTPLEGAQVILMPGKVSIMTIGQLEALDRKSMMVKVARRIIGEDIPKDAMSVYKAGDLVTEFTDVPDGVLSACVIALPANLGADKSLDEKIAKHRMDMAVHCEAIAADDNVFAVSVPPAKNFD
ncbi:MAG TPA: carboxypeptidase-like regulatory domain-containing protein, partial [Kofleriaceae bacterium]